MSCDVIRPHWVNSLLNGDALSWHKFWSTVPQVTCWRKATSHFHNKWWGVSIQIICNHYSDGRDSVSNHQPHGCLLDLSFRRRSKKTSMLRFTGLCVGNSPGTVNFPHEWPVTRKCFHLMTSSWSISDPFNIENIKKPRNIFSWLSLCWPYQESANWINGLRASCRRECAY